MVSKLETSYLRTEKHEENICQEKKIFLLKACPDFQIPPPPFPIQAQQRHTVQANNTTQCHAVQANNTPQCHAAQANI